MDLHVLLIFSICVPFPGNCLGPFLTAKENARGIVHDSRCALP